jgi:hypothetical protein
MPRSLGRCCGVFCGGRWVVESSESYVRVVVVRKRADESRIFWCLACGGSCSWVGVGGGGFVGGCDDEVGDGGTNSNHKDAPGPVEPQGPWARSTLNFFLSVSLSCRATGAAGTQGAAAARSKELHVLPLQHGPPVPGTASHLGTSATYLRYVGTCLPIPTQVPT